MVIILNAYDTIVADGYSFSDPWCKFTELRKVVAFANNTSLGFVDKNNQLVIEMISSLEFFSQTWKKLLTSSDRALNLSKCFWSIQYWSGGMDNHIFDQLQKTTQILFSTVEALAKHHWSP